MADAVQSAIYQLGYDTGDSASKLKAVQTSLDGITKSTSAFTVTEEKATTATRTRADGMDKLLARVDPLVRAEMKLQSTIEQVTRLQKEGIGTQDQANRIIDLASQKVQKYAAANDNARTATAAFGKGISSLQGLVGAFGVTLGVVGLVQFGKTVFNTTADLAEQAAQLGINVEAMQAFRGIFLQNGIDQQAGDKILAIFSEWVRRNPTAIRKLFDHRVRSSSRGQTRRHSDGPPQNPRTSGGCRITPRY